MRVNGSANGDQLKGGTPFIFLIGDTRGFWLGSAAIMHRNGRDSLWRRVRTRR